MPTPPIKITVINDQLFPINETDAEQIFQSMSAVGAEAGISVTLLLPEAWRHSPSDAETLARFYEVERTFEVAYRKSLFLSARALEKPAHGIASLGAPAFKDADVIYTRNIPTALAALTGSDKPVVYETFRPWPHQKPVLAPLIRWMVTRRRFLGAVTHSDLAGQSYIQVGLPKEKLLVAHNGYTPTRMEPRLSASEARRTLGLPLEAPIVTYAGHVNMKKGLGMMLDLARRLPDAHFVLVGSEGDGAVERAGSVLDNVQFVKWQPFSATVPYLYASDVLFIPPTAGPLTKVGNTVLPIKTFLYMASGRAIFGPATPDLEEVLTCDRNAVLVKPDDDAAAFKGLKRLLDDIEFRERIAKNAREDVSAQTWTARAARIVSFIRNRLEQEGFASPPTP